MPPHRTRCAGRRCPSAAGTWWRHAGRARTCARTGHKGRLRPPRGSRAATAASHRHGAVLEHQRGGAGAADDLGRDLQLAGQADAETVMVVDGHHQADQQHGQGDGHTQDPPELGADGQVLHGQQDGGAPRKRLHRRTAGPVAAARPALSRTRQESAGQRFTLAGTPPDQAPGPNRSPVPRRRLQAPPPSESGPSLRVPSHSRRASRPSTQGLPGACRRNPRPRFTLSVAR